MRVQIEKAASDCGRERLQERMVKLTGSAAATKAGAATEVEMKEEEARVGDALHVMRIAVEEGIMADGDAALLHVRVSISSLKSANADRDAGIKIVLRATEEPLCQIVTDAGDETLVMVSKVIEDKGNYGYNAATGKYGDLVEMGVLGLAKVIHIALQNVVSVAPLMLTIDCVMTGPSRDDAAPVMPDDIGGIGGMDGMV